MLYSTPYDSPLGELTLACGKDGEALTGLWIKGQKYFPDTLPERSQPENEPPVFRQAREWLDRYFAGEEPKIEELKLAPTGTPFRQEVWSLLCRIPYGQVTTYGTLGKALAAQNGLAGMSGQAIGGAVGHNPISIIIPCHRVVGARGSLTGYAGGLEKKIWLLKHEGVSISGLSKENISLQAKAHADLKFCRWTP